MVGRMLRKIIDWNVAICDKIEKKLPKTFGPSPSLKRRHTVAVAEKMNARPSQILLDVGGGYVCPFAEMREPELGTQFYMADISESQLQMNEAADEKIAFDASQAFPFRDETVDIFVTRTLFEHLPENDEFVRESCRVLRPGGYAIHIFPCKFAPFAILNQILPNSFANWLLGMFFPKWRGEVGFKAYYKNCYFPRFKNLMEDSKFEIETINFNYYQSIYFKFFVPFYLLSLTYDLALWALNAKFLCCEIFVVARKPA